MTNYNDGKWHGWDGGKCPVHPDTVVLPMFEGDELGGEIKAKDLEWHDDMLFDIIAFRVIREYKGPREFWIVNSYTYTTLESAETYAVTFGFEQDEIIHVREVQQ